MSTRKPFDHLPPAVAQVARRIVAPHVLPIWKRNNRVRIIPRQVSWTGELSGMLTVNTMKDLVRIATDTKSGKRSVYFSNPDQIDVNQIDQMLRENKSKCVVYVAK